MRQPFARADYKGKLFCQALGLVADPPRRRDGVDRAVDPANQRQPSKSTRWKGLRMVQKEVRIAFYQGRELSTREPTLSAPHALLRDEFQKSQLMNRPICSIASGSFSGDARR